MDDERDKSIDRETALENINQTEYTGRAERRGFLSGIFGLLGLGVGGIPQVRAANQTAVRAAAEYSSLEKVNDAMAKFAQSTLEELVSQEIIDSPDDLSPEKLVTAQDFMDGKEGTAVFGRLENGQPVTHIQIRRHLDDRSVSLVIIPQNDQSYAAVFGSDDVTTYVSSASCSPQEGSYYTCDHSYDEYGSCYCVCFYVEYGPDCCEKTQSTNCSANGLDCPLTCTTNCTHEC